jgi:hypothetical protein
MKTLIVKTQKEFDKIKSNFEGRIEIKNTKESLNINHSFNKAYIIVSDNATIESVSDNATIKYVSDNATIKYVYGNATILLFGMAIICFLYGAKKIVASGINTIRQIGTGKIDIKLSKESTLIKIKEKLSISKNNTIETYKKTYPVKTKGTKLIMYKAVRKINEEYVSDYDKNFKYEIGKIKTEVLDKNENNSCSKGIHISHLFWAYNFGRNWEDLAILEVEVNPKDVIVSKDCDGKVRASKVKVIRELDKSEY